MEKTSYEIQINGNNYVLKSQRSKDETDRIVNFVDNEINKAKNTIKYRNPAMHATLAALNIADDLYDLEIRHKSLIDESRIPLENYLPLKEEFDAYKEKHKDADQKIAQNEARIRSLEEKLNYITNERDKFKLELDRQINLSEKEKSDNIDLRNKLLEQEKISLQAQKQIQELLSQIRK